jgi:hypothetical protein
MKCTCPKCQGNIELDLPQVTEEGTSASCPLCNAALTIHTESFGARALRRSGEISCAFCGNELGPQMHCETCGTPFPKYLVTCLGRKKGRTKSSSVKLKSSPFKKRDIANSQLPSLDYALNQESSGRAKKPGLTEKKYPRNAVIAASIIVLLAVIAAGAGFYNIRKAEKTYMKNFARATYGIQVGMDTSRAVCVRMAGEWQANVTAGNSSSARPSMADEKKLNSIRAKIESMKVKFSEEPKKFQNCNQKLAGIEAAYNKMQTVALSPGGSLSAFTESINKIDAEYQKSAEVFKTELPAELMAELQAASKVYRGLKPLLR